MEGDNVNTVYAYTHWTYKDIALCKNKVIL